MSFRSTKVKILALREQMIGLPTDILNQLDEIHRDFGELEAAATRERQLLLRALVAAGKPADMEEQKKIDFFMNRKENLSFAEREKKDSIEKKKLISPRPALPN